MAALAELFEYCDKFIQRGDGFTQEDNTQFEADITTGLESFEEARQQRKSEEAVRNKTKAAQEAEALRKCTVQRVATANPTGSGFGPVVSKAVSSHADPIGGRSKKDEEAACSRLLASGKAPPPAGPKADDTATVDIGLTVGP